MGCGTSSKCSPETEKEADDNLGDSIIFVNDSKEETKEVPDEEFSTLERESLDAHNSYRKLHGSEPLVLNRKLCQMAQAYADEIAVSKDFKHSTKLRRLFKESNAGENLAAHRSKKEGGIFTGAEATKQWYDEIKKYDFEKPTGFSPSTGHFSQVVWAGTQEMGIGTARFEKDDRYWTVMVGFYYPPGNMNKPQEFLRNVKAPLATAEE